MIKYSRIEAGESTLTKKPPTGVSESMSLVLDCDQGEKVPSRELRRRRQEAYRRDLNMQIVEDAGRREWEVKRLQQLDQQHELKSVRAPRMTVMIAGIRGGLRIMRTVFEFEQAVEALKLQTALG